MTDAKPPRHKWDHDHERRFSAVDTFDGNDRNERDCVICGMTRITVMPPHPRFPWHEWRTKDGAVWVGEMTPPCVERAKLGEAA